jgi:hypothetical protein
MSMGRRTPSAVVIVRTGASSFFCAGTAPEGGAVLPCRSFGGEGNRRARNCVRSVEVRRVGASASGRGACARQTRSSVRPSRASRSRFWRQPRFRESKVGGSRSARSPRARSARGGTAYLSSRRRGGGFLRLGGGRDHLARRPRLPICGAGARVRERKTSLARPSARNLSIGGYTSYGTQSHDTGKKTRKHKVMGPFFRSRTL